MHLRGQDFWRRAWMAVALVTALAYSDARSDEARPDRGAASVIQGIDERYAVDGGPAVDRAETPADHLPPYLPRFGRQRPVVAIVGENYYTELTDYVLPYGILSASGVADVLALATQSGPIRMFPAPLRIQPQATTAAFDARYPQGADYVIVPAVHRYDDPTMLVWVQEQARKGSVIVGVCDGVLTVAAAGLLEGRQATGHWYSIDDLRKKYPQTQWQRDRRYVGDGRVITTTGVTATIPVSLALVEAIAGRAKAQETAQALGGPGYTWSSAHPSSRFRLSWQDKWTIVSNAASFWSHESLGLAIEPGVEEIALALSAEVHSATYRSTAYTVAATSEPVKTRRGLTILPDRTEAEARSLRRLGLLDRTPPLRVLDLALKDIEADYGRPTAAWVALQMEYPGY